MNTIIPRIGDNLEYSVVTSLADDQYRSGDVIGHRYPGFGLPRECDPDGTESCPKCFDQRESRISTVVSVTYYMDNSIEVLLEDGAQGRLASPPWGRLPLTPQLSVNAGQFNTHKHVRNNT